MSDRRSAERRSAERRWAERRSVTQRSAESDSRVGVVGGLRFGVSVLGRLHLLGVCVLWGAAIGLLGVYIRGGWDDGVLVWTVLLGLFATVLAVPVVVTRYAAQERGRVAGTFVQHVRAAGDDLPWLVVVVLLVASTAVPIGFAALAVFVLVRYSVPVGTAAILPLLVGGVPMIGFAIPPLAIDDKGWITALTRAWETLRRNGRTSVALVAISSGLLLILATAWRSYGPLVAGLTAVTGVGFGVWQAAITRVYLQERWEPRDPTPSEEALERDNVSYPTSF